MDLLRLYHTVKYLKPIQITSRVWKKLHRPRIPRRPAPPLRPARNANAAQWCARQPSMTGPTTFRFLSAEATLKTPGDWTSLSDDKLWLYNLHYFDDLAADGAATRADWHRALMQRWLDDCPPGTAIAWDPYPTSLRIVNWIKYLLRQSDPDPALIDSLATQTRALRRNLEWHLLGNHLFANAKALLVAGAFFDGDEARRWLTTGGEILREQLDEQILPDGGQFELSPMYQSIMIEDLLDLLQFDQLYPGVFDPNLRHQIKDCVTRMLAWLAVMTRPNGEIVQFNDAAQGIAPPPGALAAQARRLGLTAASVPERSLIPLRDSGYVRIHRGELTLFLDVGPIGPDYLPGHAHADSLNFELHLGGEPVLVDSGTGCYGTSAERQRQRSTAAHNTIEVDGLSSSEVWGGFRVARRARTTLTRLEDGDPIVVEAQHDGYQRIAGKTLHQRRWSLGDGGVIITDTLPGPFDRAVARWHLHPSVRAIPDGETAIRLETAGGQTLRLRCDQACRLTPTSYHPAFGVSQPSTRIDIEFSDSQLTVQIDLCDR